MTEELEEHLRHVALNLSAGTLAEKDVVQLEHLAARLKNGSSSQLKDVVKLAKRNSNLSAAAMRGIKSARRLIYPDPADHAGEVYDRLGSKEGLQTSRAHLDVSV